MKLLTYASPLGEPRAGLLVGETVVDLAAGAGALGTVLPPDVVSVLGLGEAGLAIARRVEAAAAAGEVPGRPLAEVRLLAAVPKPPKLLLLAANYQSHITESGSPPVEIGRAHV